MKLLGIVILYNPDESVIENIRSYINGVDTLIVWQNSEIDANVLEQLDMSNLIFLGKCVNLGIGKALNEAVEYAQKNNFTHLLTMDQDSSFEKNDVVEYKKQVNNSNSTEIGCFAPNHDWNDMEDDHKTIKATITSGSIYPVSIFQKIGLFRDDFFIDAIDTEFCYRLRRAGFYIMCVDLVKMNHSLGNKTKYHFFTFTFSSINYSPLRTYYILRNHTIVQREYPKYGKVKGFYKFFLLKRFIQILLFESNKWMKIKAQFYGLVHGWMGKTGLCKVRL